MRTRAEKIIGTMQSVYCADGQDLRGLPEPARSEAIRYGISNGLTIGRVAKELGVSRERVADACKQLDVPAVPAKTAAG